MTPARSLESRVIAWLLSNNTGTSSESMVAVFMGVERARGIDYPIDPSDFRRCYRLLQAIPEFRDMLPMMRATCGVWSRLVDHWDELTAMYEEAMKTPHLPAKKMYDLMYSLRWTPMKE
jgi:hypothetical protein